MKKNIERVYPKKMVETKATSLLTKMLKLSVF